ncbi:hypothetical protein ACMAUO_07685 [Gluconacetobacter sp. Hr-1-5]
MRPSAAMAAEGAGFVPAGGLPGWAAFGVRTGMAGAVCLKVISLS